MKLERVLREDCGLDPARPVLAGVSGGPDSLCLLGILQAAGYAVIVAHFNHRLRPEAELEAAAVSATARRLGLPFVSDSADVQQYAEKHTLSLEEAARNLRYRFLFASAREHEAQAVAVGHTADDQVETVLMHFLRGAGLSGLKGMEYRSFLPVFDRQIALVRPLLALWHTDTEGYCKEHSLETHIDPSNADQAYFRNRLRHTLIPELKKYNPRFKESVLKTAHALQSDHATLQEVLEEAWKKVLVETGAGWMAFDQPGLAKLSTGLRRNIMRRAAETLQPEERDIGFDGLERAAEFAQSPAGLQIDFINGLFLFFEKGKIYLAAYDAELPFSQWPQVREKIVIRDEGSGTREQLVESRDQGQGKSGACVELGNGWVLNVEEQVRLGDGWKLNDDNWSAWLDADRLPDESLVIRPRQAGDVFHPLGMHGQKLKVQDFFINVKIPRRARLHWPLVCAGEQVAWVVGYRIAHPLRITEKTRRILHLEIKRLPE